MQLGAPGDAIRSLVLFTVATLASLVPLRRAVRADPIEILRAS